MHFRGESEANGGEKMLCCALGWSYFQLIFLLMLTWTPMKSFFRKLRMNIHDAWLNGWALSINCVGLCSKLMDTQHLFYCPLIWVLWELGVFWENLRECLRDVINELALVSIKARAFICLQLREMFQSQPSTTRLHQSPDCRCMSKAKISKGCSLILVVLSFLAICCMHFLFFAGNITLTQKDFY